MSTIKDLRAIAKQFGIKGTSKMNKALLYQLLQTGGASAEQNMFILFAENFNSLTDNIKGQVHLLLTDHTHEWQHTGNPLYDAVHPINIRANRGDTIKINECINIINRLFEDPENNDEMISRIIGFLNPQQGGSNVSFADLYHQIDQNYEQIAYNFIYNHYNYLKENNYPLYTDENQIFIQNVSLYDQRHIYKCMKYITEAYQYMGNEEDDAIFNNIETFLLSIDPELR